MKIDSIEIRACRGDRSDPVAGTALPGGTKPPFLVVSLHTEDGRTGTSFGFGTLDPLAAGHALVPVKEFFLGRDPLERERAWREFRIFDRRWTLSPIYAYGPFDNACWDLVGQQAGLPVHRLLGGARSKVPIYVSSMFLPDPDSYAREAAKVQAAGFHGYKIHPPGGLELDLEVYRAVRAQVGPVFALMADPAGPYNYAEALRAGRVLEELAYLWFEEPVYDSDWRSQAKLAHHLDIPLAGTETLAGAHQTTAHYISEGLVDIVRSDVSWRGGITGVMKTAHLAESFGMQCELHTCIYHALDLINLHCAAAISNSTYFELLYPLSDYDFGLKTGIEIEDGYAVPPPGPGLGIDYDWNYIDDRTVAVL